MNCLRVLILAMGSFIASATALAQKLKGYVDRIVTMMGSSSLNVVTLRT